MKNLSQNKNVFLLIIFAVAFAFNAASSKAKIFQEEEINLKKYGTGKIIEKDKSIIKRITVIEIHETYIVYEKEGSLHDEVIDQIDYIDFPNAPNGPVTVKFEKSSPVVKHYY